MDTTTAGLSGDANGENGHEKANQAEAPARLDRGTHPQLAEYYDNQSEDEQVAEIEAAWDVENMTMVAVPTELVPDVLRLLARKRGA
jgi:hypothetical protein